MGIFYVAENVAVIRSNIKLCPLIPPSSDNPQQILDTTYLQLTREAGSLHQSLEENSISINTCNHEIATVTAQLQQIDGTALTASAEVANYATRETLLAGVSQRSQMNAHIAMDGGTLPSNYL